MEPTPTESKPKIEALEKDIERLTREVQEYKLRAGVEKTDESSVKEVLKERVYQAAPPPVPAAPSDDSTVSAILPAYLQQESPEVKNKVEELVGIAFQRGIDKSVEEARKFGPFVLDSLHDALTVKLYNELKNRGLL